MHLLGLPACRIAEMWIDAPIANPPKLRVASTYRLVAVDLLFLTKLARARLLAKKQGKS